VRQVCSRFSGTPTTLPFAALASLSRTPRTHPPPHEPKTKTSQARSSPASAEAVATASSVRALPLLASPRRRNAGRAAEG
jgi:hypothetical protein